MQVLLLDNSARRHEEIMVTFLKAGFLITATSSLKVAQTFLESEAVDLVIACEKINGRLSHGTVLLAEHRNPTLSTIMISDRTGDAMEELFELIPSVHSIVGSHVTAQTMLQLGRASVSSHGPRALFVSAGRMGQNRTANAEVLRAA